MDASRYQRARALFHGACDLPAREREAWLAGQCRNDVDLLDDVRSLLADAESAGSFLATPMDGIADLLAHSLTTDGEEEPAGRRIGQYTIECVIAHGGMGVVYQAMQESPHRPVALKVMRRGILSRQSLRRFRDEAEILARLRHPNIAQIYEAGAHVEESMREGGEAIPYFAMEYIPEARTITEYARQADLSIPQRLELFVKVCDAIHHGHQKGVIHRDLKPANILVDPAGEPKVIDFGVARTTNSDIAVTTQQTQVGQLVGTLQYMSPEQCDGDSTNIDSRSDVYSLGAVLYELLSGVPALDPRSSTIYQATVMVREMEPRPLSSLDRRFRGDLEAIVTRSMAKNRDHRYQSAEALKNDIERHLHGDAIDARRRSAWIGVTRWMARHPIATTAVGAVSVAVIILATALGVVWYGLTRPSHFRLINEGREAQLVTSLGKVIGSIGGGDGAAQNTAVAKIIERPARLGGGRVALFAVSTGENSTRGQLWMTELDDLMRPIWQTQPDSPSHPPDLPEDWDRPWKPVSFAVAHFLVVDVFPELPDSEIVVLHRDTEGHAQAIRVYDFGGDVLFEAWHLGQLNAWHWWADAGLLICTGDRHGTAELEKFDFPIGPVWPGIVCAIKPVQGASMGWINRHGSSEAWPDDPDAGRLVQWYKVLMPLECYQKERMGVLSYSITAPHQKYVAVDFYKQGNSELGFFFWLDRDGAVVKRVERDAFRADLQWWDPSSNDLGRQPYLVDWPPPRN